MKFNMKRPCADCPFRRDIDGYLTAGRAEDIAEAMLHGNTTFTCHKTLDWYGGGSTDADDDVSLDTDDDAADAEADDDDAWENEEGRRGTTPNSEHCAGALIFSLKHQDDIHCANSMLQIAERLGLYDPTKMDEEAFSTVFDTKQEMVDHHADSWSFRRHRHEKATSATSE